MFFVYHYDLKAELWRPYMIVATPVAMWGYQTHHLLLDNIYNKYVGDEGTQLDDWENFTQPHVMSYIDQD